MAPKQSNVPPNPAPSINTSDSANRYTRSSTQASTAKSTSKAAERDKKRLTKGAVDEVPKVQGSSKPKSTAKQPVKSSKLKTKQKETSDSAQPSVPRVTSNGKVMRRTTAEKNLEEDQVRDEEARAEQAEDLPPTRNARSKLSRLGITTDAPAQPLSALQQPRRVHFEPSDSDSDFQLPSQQQHVVPSTPTRSKAHASHVSPLPALEMGENELRLGDTDTDREVEHRPEVTLPEVMVQLRKPGNSEDTDGPSRAILVKNCTIYMDEVDPYCKITEVLPKLGQEYTPAKNRTTKYFSRNRNGLAVQISRGDALAADVIPAISALPASINHIPAAWDSINKIWELTVLSEENPAEKPPITASPQSRKHPHPLSSSPEPSNASYHQPKRSRTADVKKKKGKMRIFSPPDDEDNESNSDFGDDKGSRYSDGEDSGEGGDDVKEEATEDFDGSSLTEGRSEEHAIMISSSPEHPPKLSAVEKASLEHSAVRWLRQHWQVTRFDETPAGGLLGKTFPIREDLRRYHAITELQKKCANANQKVPGSAPKEIRGMFITVEMLKRIVGGGLEDAVEAQEWVDDPDGAFSSDYSHISLAEFDHRCHAQRAGARAIRESRNCVRQAPPAGQFAQQSNMYWNYPYPGQPGPSNWQPSYGFVPAQNRQRKGSVNSDDLDS